MDLYIGIILASFSRSGTVPVSIDLLNMFVNGMQTVCFISFSISDVILSCPELFLRFKESMQVIIYCGSVGAINILIENSQRFVEF